MRQGGDEQDEIRWHVLVTKTRFEYMVHRLLDRLGVENLYPHELRLVSHARRKIAVKKPLYPQMLFVAIAPGQSCYSITAVPGVVDFLTDLAGPKRVRPEAIALERERCDATGLVRAVKAVMPCQAPWVVAAIADETLLRIGAGPWEGYWGALKAVDKRGRADIEVGVFGRTVPLNMPLDWVERASPKVRSQRGNSDRATG